MFDVHNLKNAKNGVSTNLSNFHNTFQALSFLIPDFLVTSACRVRYLQRERSRERRCRKRGLNLSMLTQL